jgi:hypothetical protein
MDIDIQAAVHAIEHGDPVAELVVRLIAAGVSEEELHAALRGNIGDPLRCELENKYRDIARGGWTTNHYGKKWTQKRRKA